MKHALAKLVSLQTYLSAVMLVATVPLALLLAYQVFSGLQAQDKAVQDELERSATRLAASVGRAQNLAQLQQLLADNTPPEAHAALLDRQGRIVASSGLTPAPDAALRSVRREVPQTGGSITLALPTAVLDDTQRRALLAALATITACLLLGLALATLAARRITDPLRELALRGPGETPSPQRPQVQELAWLREALAEAQAREAETQERLRRKAAEFETLFASTPIGLAFLRTAEDPEPLRNPAMAALPGAVDVSLRQAAVLDLPVGPLEIEWPDAERAEEPRHLLVQAVPLPGGGALASAVDISERKRAEQRMLETDHRLQESQRLIDLAQEAGEVGFFRIDTHSATWTPGQARLFGFTPEDEAITLTQLLDRIHADDREGVEQALREMVAGRRERAALEFRVQLPDASTRWLSSRLQLSFDAQQRPRELVGATLNVNEQKASELERAALAAMEQRARIEAEEANRAKDEFLAMLGHELRNPLGAIGSAAEVLNQLDARTGQAAKPSLSASENALAASARAIIARQTRHLARLVDDLLDIGRVISGKVLLSRARTDLAALVRRSVENFRVTGATERHELRLDLAPVWVEADGTRVEQVVNNLLGNALKYTPAGRRIEISLAVRDGMAQLDVRDHGDGIPQMLLPHIFDLFVQGERLLDRSAGGLGIGLTLVRRLVEMHGGTVAAESSGTGSCFTVRLPAVVAAPASARPPADPRAPRCTPCRVLVIEDNEDASATLRTMLELDGHQVSHAADGRQGLALLLAERPDLAIVDIGLPGLSGYELARQARRAGYGGRLLALSGYGSDADIAQSLRHGFDAHFAKPVDPKRLRRMLEGADEQDPLTARNDGADSAPAPLDSALSANGVA